MLNIFFISVDDLQWSDLTSLELIAEMLQIHRPNEFQLFLVVSSLPISGEMSYIGGVEFEEKNRKKRFSSVPHEKDLIQLYSALKGLSQTTFIELGPLCELDCVELYKRILGKSVLKDEPALKKCFEVTDRTPIFLVRYIENKKLVNKIMGDNTQPSRRRNTMTTGDASSKLRENGKIADKVKSQSVSNFIDEKSNKELETQEEIISEYFLNLWQEEQDFLSVISAVGSFVDVELMFNALVKIYSSAKLSHLMGILDQLERKGILIFKRRESREEKIFVEGYEFNNSSTRYFAYNKLQADRKREIHLVTAKHIEYIMEGIDSDRKSEVPISSTTANDPEQLGDSLCDLIAHSETHSGYIPFGVIASHYERAFSFVKAVSYYVIAAEVEIGHHNGRMALHFLAYAQNILDVVWNGSREIDVDDGDVLPESVVERIHYLISLALKQCGWIVDGHNIAERFLMVLEHQMTVWRAGLKLMAASEIYSGILKLGIPALFSGWNKDETLFWAGNLMNWLFIQIGLGNMDTLSGLCWAFKTVNILEEYAFPTPELLISYGHLILTMSLIPTMKKICDKYIKKGEKLAEGMHQSLAVVNFKTFVALSLTSQGQFSKALEILEETTQLVKQIPANPQNFSNYLGVTMTTLFLFGKFDDAKKFMEQEFFLVLENDQFGQRNFHENIEAGIPCEIEMLTYLRCQCHFFEISLKTLPIHQMTENLKKKLTDEIKLISKRWTRDKISNEEKQEIKMSKITSLFDFRLLASGLLFATCVEDINAAQFLLQQIFDKFFYGNENIPLLTRDISLKGGTEFFLGSEGAHLESNTSKNRRSNHPRIDVTHGIALLSILEAILRLRSLVSKESMPSLEEHLWFVHGLVEKTCSIFEFINCDLWIIEAVYAFIHTREVTSVKIFARVLDHARKYKMRYQEGLAGAYIQEMFKEKPNGEEAIRARKMLENLKIPNSSEIAHQIGCSYNLISTQKKFWRGLFKLGKYQDS
ncbi:hypothetical protein HK096_004661, partial [Nowakowskiella sp. JEL0078]